MKLTSSITALVAVMGLALASAPVSLQAQTAPATTTASAPAKTAKAKPVEYMGSLTAVDATGNTVTVMSGTKSLTLSIAATTKIQKDKKTATLADFMVGDKVTGSYTVDATTGAMTAKSLRKKTAKAAATSAATAAAPAAAKPAGQ